MEKEILFTGILEQVKQTAKEQGNCISEDQIKEAFAELELSKEQLEMVYAYLKSNKIGIGEPVSPEDYMTDEEKDYLQDYMEAIMVLEEVGSGEKEAITLSSMAGDKDAQNRLTEVYLKDVVEIAKLYAGQGVYMEDLIGEGNMALASGVQMLGCLERAEEAEGMLVNMVMNAMESYIMQNAEMEKADRKIADKVNKVTELAKEMAEEMRRKVTPEELAAETKLSMKSIMDAIRISGNKIEYLESGYDGK